MPRGKPNKPDLVSACPRLGGWKAVMFRWSAAQNGYAEWCAGEKVHAQKGDAVTEAKEWAENDRLTYRGD